MGSPTSTGSASALRLDSGHGIAANSQPAFLLLPQNLLCPAGRET